MSVVSNISESRLSREPEGRSVDRRTRAGRAASWFYLLLLWALATALLAFGASAVIGFGS